MSSFVDDQDFAESLVKGNLAEIAFERLAVHAGWWVRYRGDQYHLPISPKTKCVEGGSRTPDFEIAKARDSGPRFTVEVKFQSRLDKNAVHKRGVEDFRVVLSPDGYRVYPEKKAAALQIASEDWNRAVGFLKKMLSK